MTILKTLRVKHSRAKPSCKIMQKRKNKLICFTIEVNKECFY